MKKQLITRRNPGSNHIDLTPEQWRSNDGELIFQSRKSFTFFWVVTRSEQSVKYRWLSSRIEYSCSNARLHDTVGDWLTHHYHRQYKIASKQACWNDCIYSWTHSGRLRNTVDSSLSKLLTFFFLLAKCIEEMSPAGSCSQSEVSVGFLRRCTLCRQPTGSMHQQCSDRKTTNFYSERLRIKCCL